MSTLLDRTRLPLWVFIVIIVVGSLCILGTVGFIIRCVLVKRTHAPSLPADEFAAPMRRVTVRRGRVVPASHYMSLTGSRFGLNEFENEATSTRSKSPLQWWNKVNAKQNQDEMSQRDSIRYSGSVYGRKEFAQSSNSLSTPEKQPPSSVHEVLPAPPSPTALPSPRATPSPTLGPSRPQFTRPFHSANPSSPFIHDRRLSAIDEGSSPHNSMISNNSRRRSSKLSINPAEANLTRYDPRRGSRKSSNNTPTASNTSLPSQTASPKEVLMPLAYRGSRSSLGEPEAPRPSLSHRSSTNSRHDSVHDYYEGRGSSSSPRSPLPPLVEQPHQRPDGHLTRTSSKRGNVLRKKSLMRMEMTNMVQ